VRSTSQGFEEITNYNQIATGPIWHDLNTPDGRRNIKQRDMVYGVPLIVGAKKGLPNFQSILDADSYPGRTEAGISAPEFGGQVALPDQQMFILGFRTSSE
jgi:hypothetical protein